ncbi:MAG: hypothetical protein RR249_09275 [Tannerellaceae bacterium]
MKRGIIIYNLQLNKRTIVAELFCMDQEKLLEKRGQKEHAFLAKRNKDDRGHNAVGVAP